MRRYWRQVTHRGREELFKSRGLGGITRWGTDTPWPVGGGKAGTLKGTVLLPWCLEFAKSQTDHIPMLAQSPRAANGSHGTDVSYRQTGRWAGGKRPRPPAWRPHIISCNLLRRMMWTFSRPDLHSLPPTQSSWSCLPHNCHICGIFVQVSLVH